MSQPICPHCNGPHTLDVCPQVCHIAPPKEMVEQLRREGETRTVEHVEERKP